MKSNRGVWAAMSLVAGLAVLAGLLVASSASAKPERATAKYQIGEVFYQTDPFQVALQKWAKRWAKQKDISLAACDQKGQAQLGINCVNDWIAQGLDGIIYAPADPAAAVKPVQDAQAANIPIIAIVIKPNPPAKLPYLTAAERKQTFAAGQAAARQAKKFFAGQQLSVLALDLLNLPICKQSRMGGFIAGVKSISKGAKVYDIGAKGDRLDATNRTADFLQSGRKVNIVTACTGEMIQGALAALKSAGRGKAVNKRPQTEYIFAIDGDKQQLQQLLDKSSPVMQSMGLAPKEQSLKQINLLLEVIQKKIPLTSTKVVGSPGRLIGPTCKSVNSYLTTEYLEKPLSCK
jgi:ABC-type sugar transport system substrate-binding protein